MAHHKIGSSRETPSRLGGKSPRVTSESKLVGEGIKMLKSWNELLAWMLWFSSLFDVDLEDE